MIFLGKTGAKTLAVFYHIWNTHFPRELVMGNEQYVF